MLGPDLLITGV